MDIRYFKAFLAVFEERNITSAAQRLFISRRRLNAAEPYQHPLGDGLSPA
ncbi:hypothetical protein PS870_06506 [Pseudomonas fluorescens]|uniref:HTH lysR-type domain-containing protein n=1 Tax=Pseudomonas fluorescens TaxID=294 RepID=A0A5E7QKJ5_PSEFL|nr:hypothetical protein PS870_06506 [Pseudomonas fluorescens]